MRGPQFKETETEKPRCANCIFWYGSEDMPYGCCRRHAPSVIQLSRGASTCWPFTMSDAVCGEFEPRKV
jgi:hypothetical protein